MLRSSPNTCRGPTGPWQTEGEVLQTRCQHVAGTLGRGGTSPSKLPRRVQEAHRCESHLVFCCLEVILFLCGHWPVYLCSPGSGRWTFQGPCRAACVLCSHGRCHMSALLPGELEGGIVPLESKVLLQSANPTGCAATALSQHPLLSHQSLRDGGHPVQKAWVEPCVSTGRWGAPAPACHNPARGAQSPSITGYKGRPLCHLLSLIPPVENRAGCPQVI